MRLLTTCALCLFAGSATAQQWSTQFDILGPAGGTYGYSGDFVGEPYYEAHREDYLMGWAFFSPDSPFGTPCVAENVFEFDLIFGRTGHHEMQFLFQLERTGTGEWALNFPAAFINLDTMDGYAVELEMYSGEGAQMTLNEVTCVGPQSVFVDVSFDFSGQPYSGKGPTMIGGRGSVQATVEILPYDQY